MKILRVIPSLNPASGGPIAAASQIDKALGGLGHSVDVVCLDQPGASFHAAYPGRVTALGPSISSYLYNSKLVPFLKEAHSSYDAVIINGLWQYHGFAAWRALSDTSTPYFVFTHGMLDPWFKQEYPLKHLKKWLYWPWAEYRILRDARGVIFTTEEERLQSRKSFSLYKCNEVVTAYGTSPPPAKADLVEGFLLRWPALEDKRILLFLGRIHEKKGCDLLIEAFSRVAFRDSRLHLVMAGPDQDGWALDLKKLVDEKGLADRITWTGMLTGAAKWGAFYAAEVFCLPSHQENFGVAVAEALACGKPALISDKVNIWREVVEDNAGLAEPDTLEGAFSLLTRWCDLDEATRASMSVAATACFNERFHIDRVAKSLLNILAQVSAENEPHTK